MATIQDLVTALMPDESKARLMEQLGYDDHNAVDSVVSMLTMQDLETAAKAAGLKPPLTIREKRALLAQLQPAGPGQNVSAQLERLAEGQAVLTEAMRAVQNGVEAIRLVQPFNADLLKQSFRPGTASEGRNAQFHQTLNHYYSAKPQRGRERCMVLGRLAWQPHLCRASAPCPTGGAQG